MPGESKNYSDKELCAIISAAIPSIAWVVKYYWSKAMNNSERGIRRRGALTSLSRNTFRLLLFSVCAALCLVASLVAVAGGDKTPAQNKAAAVSYTVGAIPESISVADFNNDGKPDLITANFDSDNVSILVGAGNGTFLGPVNYPIACFGPWSVATGDFNGDNKLDFATADGRCSSGSLMLGNGGGSFQGPTAYNAGFCPQSVITGDFNADNKLDLVVANGELCLAAPSEGGSKQAPNIGGNSVNVLLGNGNGTFQSPSIYPVGSGPTEVLAADYNRDGKLDLAVTNAGGSTLSILIGNGNGTFQPAVSHATDFRPFSLTKGDFNGDGNVDLAIAHANSASVSVLFGNGNGTFQTATSYPTDARPNSIIAANINGDDKVDLVTANAESNSVSVLLGNADGTFQPPINFPVGANPSSVASADFDGDGKFDLAITNRQPGSVTVLLNCPGLTAVTPTSKLFTMGGGQSGVKVSPMSLCNWTAASNDNWIELTSSGSGDGSQPVTYLLRENFTGSARQGSLTVGAQTVTIVQDGGLPAGDCGFSISPPRRTAEAGGGNGTITVTGASACAWQAASDSSWIFVTSTPVGIGNGAVTYSIAANSTGVGREGTITVAGKKCNIKQKGS